MKAKNREEIFLKALADGEEPKIKALTRKEILLKKQSKRESEGPHWNDIDGKPFGGYKFTWDGNTDGKDTVSINGGIATMCKVSDEIVTPQDLDGAKMTISTGEVIEVSSADFSEKDGAYTYKDSSIALIPNAMTGAGLNFPSGGVYFMKLNNVFHVAELSNLQTIDPKYLPSGGGAFVVNFITEDGVEYTSDKTFDEIDNAINNGMYVYGCSQGEPGAYTFLNLEVFATGMLIMFGATFGMRGDYYHMEMTINPDNSVESVQVKLTTN